MEYKFVTSGAIGTKRKRPHAACDSCNRKKKRCFHGEETASETLPSIPLFTPPPPFVPRSNTMAEKHPESDAMESIPPRNSQPTSVGSRITRFLGDTHAEANLELDQGEPSDQRDQDNVGIWFDDQEDVDSDRSQVDGESPLAKVHLIRDQDRDRLVDIFITRVQPLLPILEQAQTTTEGRKRLSETLTLAVCLVAAKDSRARDHLRFHNNPSPLPVHLFTRKLYLNIVGRIKNWRSFNRLELIRILALVSTHHEGPNGTEESSLLAAQAIQHAYLMGIHLKRHSGNIANPSAYEDNVRLFWCLWSLDKVAAAIDGRPRMAYEMDVGLDFNESLHLFEVPGRLYLKLARLLSSVNDLYNPRPCVDTENHLREFPRWEELLETEDVSKVDEGFLTTCELLYHSASMLSCRIKFLVGHKRAFASSLRRYLSAATVYAISKCTPASDLAPLPVVPYAYCLGTLVAYQQYRCAKRRIHQSIAEEKLAHFQEQLQAMASCWYAAKSMARKVQRVLKEFRRAKAAAADGRQQTTNLDRPSQIDSSHLSTISPSEVDTPDSLQNIGNDGQQDEHLFHAQTAAAGGGGGGNMALSDMDIMFGNLMDMNAFTGDIEFALDPTVSVSYDPAMWAGEGAAAPC